MNKLRILVFEDERTIADTLLYALRTEGFVASHATTAAQGFALLEREAFDMILLDIGLPDMNGFEVCKRLRKMGDIPIFFLTARGEEIDKVLGLEIGADDYITKPFSPREVTARIKTLFRRLRAFGQPESKFSRGPFAVDRERFQISYHDQPLDLTRYEFGLLQVLVEKPGRVFSRAQLMTLIWDEPDMSLERTIDTHIKSIRGKLRERAAQDFILTHRGLGYSLSENLE